MKALILGKRGQVAQELVENLPKKVKAIAFGRDDIDITDAQELENAIIALQIDVIINAAAYTAVDKAESDERNAFLINETAVLQMAKVASKLNKRFIHISTDFVFDGSKAAPYLVDDVPNPLNVYGTSKLGGEKAIKEHCPENSAIVRTSWLYSKHGNNFVKTMLRLLQEKDELNIVADQVGSPTSAKGLAEFLWGLADQKVIDPIYHYSDLGVASWYDFAVAIQDIAFEAGLLNKQIPVKPIPSDCYPTPARRPKFSTLLNSGEGLHWRKALHETLMVIKK
ncbi:dTDP-4-dehydrorhamnose reductase [Pseudoalteromonas luteoviolacea]|nr:dTDP-4-dehydrorhamnose reductase [Pseudoalteromonas luteoviolacea]